MGNLVNQAGEQARQEFEKVADRVNEGFEHSRELVRSHPTQSVAAALGVGLVLGTIVGLALRGR
jgi:ElaB/YqjD/DUF883 family membrane-anchored ribosome-binding protein